MKTNKCFKHLCAFLLFFSINFNIDAMDDKKGSIPTEENSMKKVLTGPVARSIQSGFGIGLSCISLVYTKATVSLVRGAIKNVGKPKRGGAALLGGLFGLAQIGTASFYGFIAAVTGSVGGYNAYKGCNYFYNKHRKQTTYSSRGHDITRA